MLQCFPGEVERGDCLLTTHRWKLFKKRIERISRGEVVDQILHGNSGTHEHRRSAEDIWITVDDRSNDCHFDLVEMHQSERCTKAPGVSNAYSPEQSNPH